MDRLMKGHNYNQDGLAGIFSKSKATISETLSLNKLPQPVRDECRQDHMVPILIARNNPKPTVKTTKAQSTINAMEATREKMRAELFWEGCP